MTLDQMLAKMHKDVTHWYVYTRAKKSWLCVGNYTLNSDADRRVQEIVSNSNGVWREVEEIVVIKTHETRSYISHEIKTIH